MMESSCSYYMSSIIINILCASHCKKHTQRHRRVPQIEASTAGAIQSRAQWAGQKQCAFSPTHPHIWFTLKWSILGVGGVARQAWGRAAATRGWWCCSPVPFELTAPPLSLSVCTPQILFWRSPFSKRNIEIWFMLSFWKLVQLIPLLENFVWMGGKNEV